MREISDVSVDKAPKHHQTSKVARDVTLAVLFTSIYPLLAPGSAAEVSCLHIHIYEKKKYNMYMYVHIHIYICICIYKYVTASERGGNNLKFSGI